jgi:hypothetical protein
MQQDRARATFVGFMHPILQVNPGVATNILFDVDLVYQGTGFLGMQIHAHEKG